MKSDPALETVRKVRRDISEEFGHDPARLIAHYAEMQATFKGQLIHGPEEHLDDDGKEPEDAASDAANGCRRNR